MPLRTVSLSLNALVSKQQVSKTSLLAWEKKEASIYKCAYTRICSLSQLDTNMRYENCKAVFSRQGGGFGF